MDSKYKVTGKQRRKALKAGRFIYCIDDKEVMQEINRQKRELDIFLYGRPLYRHLPVYKNRKLNKRVYIRKPKYPEVYE